MDVLEDVTFIQHWRCTLYRIFSTAATCWCSCCTWTY